ncbi:MAG: hypothetical protein KMY53_12915 [Desulfarculus sp.]|nr:hypothetical protein [Pseudomonadota bacterium]MBV1715730.1 hypothetical protein [Desulfarculus sp.]MBU4575745.1 hypothetical protein [Pseudomonadota bacterium]MBU4597267.1 hypothetical protein [Pseudomonadota bacterium]MBV1739063.1 hypothetical protein [Desulfarculus sp.]
MRELKIFDKAVNVKRLLICLYVFLAGLLVADFFISKHGHFSWENAPEFYAVYGFLCYLALIVLAKALRRIIKRREDYYD